MHTQLASNACPHCQTDLTPYMSLPQAPAFCLQCKFPLKLIAGKYQLQRVLGEGGFGTVYLARHVRLERNAERVVKLIKPEVFQYEGMEKRFYREVQLTSDLSQRNEHIVRIYDDFGEEPHIGHYYVMEYLQGKSLLDYIKRSSQLPKPAWSLAIFRQLCDAMQAAHEEGIIHRDLKPENIILIERRKDPYFVKVLDFGIAKPMQTGGETTKLTRGALGTPYYMSPEQTMNKPIDGRSDIYSMAIMLFEMLTGHHPFIPPDKADSISAMELMSAHVMQAIPDICEVYPHLQLPAAVGAAICKAAAKKPEDRFQTAEAFWATLEAGAGRLAQVRPTELRDLLPEELGRTPSEQIRQAPSAFAATQGSKDVAVEANIDGDSEPRSTPTVESKDVSRPPTSERSVEPDASMLESSAEDVSRPPTSERPSEICVEPVNIPTPRRQATFSRRVEDELLPRRMGLWIFLTLLLVGGGVGGFFVVGSFFSKTVRVSPSGDGGGGMMNKGAAPGVRVPTTSDDSLYLKPRPIQEPSIPARKLTIVRTPLHRASSSRQGLKKRRRRRRWHRSKRKVRRPNRSRPAPPLRLDVAKKASGCPKPGWILLVIHRCPSGGREIEVSGEGLPKALQQKNRVCVPAGKRISVDQIGCAECIFKTPTDKARMDLYLKNSEAVDINVGRSCLQPGKP